MKYRRGERGVRHDATAVVLGRCIDIVAFNVRHVLTFESDDEQQALAVAILGKLPPDKFSEKTIGFLRSIVAMSEV